MARTREIVRRVFPTAVASFDFPFQKKYSLSIGNATSASIAGCPNRT